MMTMLASYKRLYLGLLAAASVSALYFWLRIGTSASPPVFELHNPSTSVPCSSNGLPTTFLESLAQHFIDYPPKDSNYADQFAELGSKVRLLRDWISLNGSEAGVLNDKLEQAIITLFPFLRNPSKPDDKSPFSRTFRFACHLVLAIREVHHSKLPIQIVYAGDSDLPPKNRRVLADLAKNIEFLDILKVFDDESLQLASGGWAIKPFAVLASKFEKIILLDADSVFVQAPESTFQQKGYKETGVLLYHDRLLWQHGFGDRHDWWKKQMEHNTPSPALLKSLVWMEDYAEEGDSGLVIVDKSRLPVLMGLLHVCWQNTYAVREGATYKMTHGDKESWWFGFELSGTPFAFENHYGSIAGGVQTNESDGSEKVCSFTIAHTDDRDKLLWYNGSLLKNKAVDNMTFEAPTHWMMDATWQKGGSKAEISCMEGGEARQLTASEMDIIKRSIKQAERFDVLAESSLIS